MKSNSNNLKKTNETTVVRAFWGKEWADLKTKEEKLGVELEGIVRELDKDPVIQEMMGRDKDALLKEGSKQKLQTQTAIQTVWAQVERFGSVRGEFKKANFTKRRIDELLGLAEEVFQALDHFEDANVQDYQEFMEQHKETIQLERDLRDGDKVRGFDLENVDETEIMFDLGRFEELFGEEEERMIEKFYAACDLLGKKRDLELESIAESDVASVPQSAYRPIETCRGSTRQFEGKLQPFHESL